MREFQTWNFVTMELGKLGRSRDVAMGHAADPTTASPAAYYGAVEDDDAVCVPACREARRSSATLLMQPTPPHPPPCRWAPRPLPGSMAGAGEARLRADTPRCARP